MWTEAGVENGDDVDVAVQKVASTRESDWEVRERMCVKWRQPVALLSTEPWCKTDKPNSGDQTKWFNFKKHLFLHSPFSLFSRHMFVSMSPVFVVKEKRRAPLTSCWVSDWKMNCFSSDRLMLCREATHRQLQTFPAQTDCIF